MSVPITIVFNGEVSAVAFEFWGAAGIIGAPLEVTVNPFGNAWALQVDAIPDAALFGKWTATQDGSPIEVPADLTLNRLWLALQSGGSGLSDGTLAKLEAAASILLASPYTPTDAPVVILEQGENPDLCYVNFSLKDLGLEPKAGVVITVGINGSAFTNAPTASLYRTKLAVTTDAGGLAVLGLVPSALLQGDTFYNVSIPVFGTRKIAVPSATAVWFHEIQ